MTDADYIRMTNSTNHIHTPRRGWDVVAIFFSGVAAIAALALWVLR